MKKEIREGERIPKGYGIAYREMEKLVAIAYPIPINLIVGGIRRLWLWCMYGHKLYEDGYVKGYHKGITEGRDYAFNQFKSQVLRDEVAEIVKNLIAIQDEMFKLFQKGDENEIDVFIWRFIDKEVERIIQPNKRGGEKHNGKRSKRNSEDKNLDRKH